MNSTELSHEITGLQSNITNRLDELRLEKNTNQKKADILNIEKKLLPELLGKRIERDIPNLSADKRNELVFDVSEFISKSKEKGYFTDENILIALKQITQGLSNFRQLPSGAIYGQWNGYRGGGTLELDFNKEPNFMRHIVFHELAHCITPDLGSISQATVQTDRKTEKGFKIWARKAGYEFGWHENEVTFLKECMAESMACDLEGINNSRTKVGLENSGITSDWITPYNRTYQELGDEFLQTLSFINTSANDTDRKRFKALTMMAIMPNNDIAKQIDAEYSKKSSKNDSKDLEQISLKLGKLLHRTSATKEEVDEIRSLLAPYKEQPKKFEIKTPEKKEEEVDSEEKEILEILALYSQLSPKGKAEAYAKFFSLEKDEEDILEDFFNLSPEARKNFVEKDQKEK